MGPEEQVEGDLHGACIKHHFIAQGQLDEGQHQVADIAIDERRLVDGAQAQGLSKKPGQQDPQEIGDERERDTAEEAENALPGQFDLERVEDHARTEDIDREGRQHLAALPFHETGLHNDRSQHDPDEHGRDVLHQCE